MTNHVVNVKLGIDTHMPVINETGVLDERMLPSVDYTGIIIGDILVDRGHAGHHDLGHRAVAIESKRTDDHHMQMLPLGPRWNK